MTEKNARRKKFRRHKLDWSEKAEVTFTLFPSCGEKVTEDKDWVGSEARKSSEVTIYTICVHYLLDIILVFRTIDGQKALNINYDNPLYYTL